MFNHKKFLAALLCTPLFTACVVNGDDTDDVGNTETDPTGNTLTTTVGTDDSSGTLTTTVGTEESESGSESVDSGSSDEGTTGEPGGMFCVAACEEAIDCCDPANPLCADAAGAYPYNYTCDAGICGLGDGCAAASDCEAVYPGAGYECILVDGYGFCELPCTTTMDCADAFLTNYECLDDGASGTTCQFSCTDSAQCGVEGAICEDDGSCTYPGCDADEDCLQGGTCDVATGLCGCADATECVEGYTCAA